MRCLFVHDFRSYRLNDDVYTTNLSYEILKKRYVDIFGELYILNRSGVLNANQNPAGMVKASGDGVHFVDEIDIFSPTSFASNYGQIKAKVIDNVSRAEYVIIRLDSFLGLIAAEYCRKNKKKYLIEVVGCVWDSFWNKGIYGKMIAFPLLKRMQKEILCAPYVVYVTKEFLQGRYPTNGQNTNISNVQLNNLKESSLDYRLEKIERISEEKNNIYDIVTVASVEVRYKGQEDVIRAIAELKKKGKKNYRYHLIGGGNPSYLMNLSSSLGVEEEIIFHGSMNHEKVMSFLDNCDIYIQPSKQEGLPRSLIEGMSKGLLCYGTKIAGIPELLEKEFLFGTSKKNYIEITHLLDSVTKELCVNQAIRNFNESKKYEANLLEKRRYAFFTDFRNNSCQ